MSKSLLCATDGSKSSTSAVLYAAKLAKALDAKLTYVTVSRVSPKKAAKTHFWDSELLQAGDAMTHSELSAAAKAAKKMGVEARWVVTYGKNVSKALVAYAESKGHDHLIIGTHGRGRAARAALGSVAADLTQRAHCPVTVVR